MKGAFSLNNPLVGTVRPPEILVAIVSQIVFVLVFMGYRTIIARYVANWGLAQMCLCKIKYQGGYRTILGEC